MPEDWNAIAAEVDAAIKSVADVSQAGGYPAALAVSAGGDAYTYHTVYVIEGVREIRDITGTMVVETLRTLMISATGQAPEKGNTICVGVDAAAAQVGDHIWNEIGEVRPLSPAGIAVLYEVDLVGDA